MCLARSVFSLFLLLTGVCAQAENARNPRIEWQPSTLRLVAENGVYARVIRLRSGALLCCYEKGKQCWIKRSGDEGLSWGQERVVTSYAHGKAANPEMLQLKNGALLFCYNERPNDGVSPFAIAVTVSRDEGASWGDSRRIFEGGTKPSEGCWEPAALQFPDGEIQLYFANEAPYPRSDEQEISRVCSTDSATSWSRAETVSFRAGTRDGMPVPRLLNDGKTVVMAIEDNGVNGRFKPAILCSDVESRWRGRVIGGDSPCRWFALSERLPDEVYAGAPYICQMPNGDTLLSMQSDEGRHEAQMVVSVGDEKARAFRHRSVPFALEDGVAGKWNSLFVKNSNTVTAVSSTTLHGKSGIWIIDGCVKDAE